LKSWIYDGVDSMLLSQYYTEYLRIKRRDKILAMRGKVDIGNWVAGIARFGLIIKAII